MRFVLVKCWRCTSNDYGYQAAIDWYQSGGKVSVICDARSNPRASCITKLWKWVWRRPHIIDDRSSVVEGAMMAELLDDVAGVSGRSENVVADVIATSGGFSPVVHLSAHLGQKPYGMSRSWALPNRTAICCARAALKGFMSWPMPCRRPVRLWLRPWADSRDTRSGRTQYRCSHGIPDPASCRYQQGSQAIVDLQNDVTASGIELACREGFESIEHVKRYT